MVQTFFSLIKGNRRCKDHLKEKGQENVRTGRRKGLSTYYFPLVFPLLSEAKNQREKN